MRTYFTGGTGGERSAGSSRRSRKSGCGRQRSELYALILEAREIKRLLPRYNTAGRGEGSRWFVRLDADEPYSVPERVAAPDKEDGAIYLGPYRSAGVLDTCIEALGRIFPFRRCSGGWGRGVLLRPDEPLRAVRRDEC